MTATDKEQFDTLYESLRSYQTGFIDAAFKVTASLLLILGWLITSEPARKFLTADSRARTTAIIALVLSAVLYAVTSYRVYLLSQRTRVSLDQLEYMPAEHYSNRVLQRATIAIFIFVNVGLVVVESIFVALLSP